jgi:hypothetical protein
MLKIRGKMLWLKRKKESKIVVARNKLSSVGYQKAMKNQVRRRRRKKMMK